MKPPATIEHTIALIIKEQWGRLLAILAQSFGDIELAEDVLQDAVEKALLQWKRFGIPDAPAAWLLKTAKHKAIDRYRKDRRFQNLKDEIQHLQLLEEQPDIVDLDKPIPDKRLELMYACCHPSLAQKTQIMLTLHTLGGLSTAQIASAFLSKPEAVAQRLVRAKRQLKADTVSFDMPLADAIPARTKSVLSTIYLIFNEGYKALSGKTLTLHELSDEAIRLNRILLGLLNDNGEVAGLLALMLLHDSRRYARTDRNGALISLENQNRRLWNKHKIEEGITLLEQALVKSQLGPYQLQAAISAVHAQASDWVSTDWPQIVALYDLLYQLQPSKVIRINQAVAISYGENTNKALLLLDELNTDNALAEYQPYFAARADILLRLGKLTRASANFDKAIALSDNDAERHFLQLKKLEATSQSPLDKH